MMDLTSMRDVDIQTVDPDTLADIKDVKINVELPREERLLDFIRQIKNPYCYKCGKVVIKNSYADTNVTLEDRLEFFLLSL